MQDCLGLASALPQDMAAEGGRMRKICSLLTKAFVGQVSGCREAAGTLKVQERVGKQSKRC